MRAIAIFALIPLLAACEPDPAPQPEPRRTADPAIIQAENDRRELLSGKAQKGDFRANFGEPFIAFENRGERLSISQSYSQPNVRVIDVARSITEQGIILRGKSDAVNTEEPFVLTIERGSCVNEFSGERTRHTAWLGTQTEPRRVRSCAAPAR